MKFKNFLLFFLTPFLLTGFHCRKNPVLPQLPTETQTGANTFGCKINGELWLPKGAFPTTPAYRVQYYKSDGALLIKTNRSNKGESLNIYLYGVYKDSTFIIFNPPNNAFNYSNSNSSSSCNWYDRTNSVQTGSVTITKLDLTTKIVSGKFDGTLKIAACPDIVITEGRFDFKMDIFN